MKVNLPVTDWEKHLPPTTSLVSKTDLKGTITYVNDAFCEASGFTREELIGKNHNIVRHPDMPPAVFAWMWRTLKRGLPWRGLVKNRCKDGSYYWVDASVVPVRKDDQTIGYMSVRRYAAPDRTKQAQIQYDSLRESGADIKEKEWPNLLTIRMGFLLGSLFVVILLFIGGALGIGGLRLSDQAMERIHTQQVEPLQTADRINALILENRAAVLATQNPDAVSAELIDQRRQTIQALWERLEKMPLSPEASKAVTEFHLSYQRYVDEGMRPLRNALLVKNLNYARDLLSGKVAPRYRDLAMSYLSLQEVLGRDGAQIMQETRERNSMIEQAAIVGILFGILIAVVVGSIFIRNIVDPLASAIHRFDRIAQGDLSGDVTLSGTGEAGQVNRAVATMQLHLKVMLDEITLVTKNIYDSCQHLNTSLFDVMTYSDEQNQQLQLINEGIQKAGDRVESLNVLVQDIGQLSAELLQSSEEAGSVIWRKKTQELCRLVQELSSAIQAQHHARSEVKRKMEHVSNLIIENRYQTQTAYAASDDLKLAADQLVYLVSYFETVSYPDLHNSHQLIELQEQLDIYKN